MARLSVLGLYNFDNTLLDGLKECLPNNDDEKQAIISLLLAQTAELEFLYPNPVTAKELIRCWAVGRMPSWMKIYQTENKEYDSISNYDRTQTTETSGTTTTKTAGFNTTDLVNNGGETGTGSESIRAYGNIGVTTTQQMIEEERKCRKYNFSLQVVDEFKNMFCIMVY